MERGFEGDIEGEDHNESASAKDPPEDGDEGSTAGVPWHFAMI